MQDFLPLLKYIKPHFAVFIAAFVAMILVGLLENARLALIVPVFNQGLKTGAEANQTETLIKSLSNLPNLNVKPRSSVFRYKGKDTDLHTIVRELNVQAILNGRVVQRGEQLTLSLELVDVSQDKVIWSEQL